MKTPMTHNEESMDKPIVKITNANFVYIGGNFRMTGVVVDHPRFEEGVSVVTSKIVRVETKNTVYELVEATND